MANYVTTLQPQFVCCDMVKRLTNDVQMLQKDLNVLIKLQSCYKTLEDQYDKLLIELDHKLRVLRSPEASDSLINDFDKTSVKVGELVDFIRYVWKLITQRLTKISQSDKFQSVTRETPLVPLAEKIRDFILHASLAFYPHFAHLECGEMFKFLSNTVTNVITPEILHADSFEQSLSFITRAIPCAINLTTIVDLFTNAPRLRDMTILCTEVLEGVQTNVRLKKTNKSFTHMTPLVSYLKSQLPNEKLMFNTEPVVHHRSSSFCHLAHQMVKYLIRMSINIMTPDKEPKAISTFSVLNSSYMNFLEGGQGPPTMSYFQPLYISPQYVNTSQIPHVTRYGRNTTRLNLLDRSDLANFSKNVRGRRPRRQPYYPNQLGDDKSMCRLVNPDLEPIKLPELSGGLIKPFDY